MSIFDEKRAELERHEFMMGAGAWPAGSGAGPADRFADHGGSTWSVLRVKPQPVEAGA